MAIISYQAIAMCHGYWVDETPREDGYYAVFHMNTFFVPEGLYDSVEEAWKGICKDRRLQWVDE